MKRPSPATLEKFLICFAVNRFLIFLAKTTLKTSVRIMVTMIDPRKSRVFATEIFLPITYVEITPIQKMKVKGFTLLTRKPFNQNSR